MGGGYVRCPNKNKSVPFWQQQKACTQPYVGLYLPSNFAWWGGGLSQLSNAPVQYSRRRLNGCSLFLLVLPIFTWAIIQHHLYTNVPFSCPWFPKLYATGLDQCTTSSVLQMMLSRFPNAPHHNWNIVVNSTCETLITWHNFPVQLVLGRTDSWVYKHIICVFRSIDSRNV